MKIGRNHMSPPTSWSSLLHYVTCHAIVKVVPTLTLVLVCPTPVYANERFISPKAVVKGSEWLSWANLTCYICSQKDIFLRFTEVILADLAFRLLAFRDEGFGEHKCGNVTPSNLPDESP